MIPTPRLKPTERRRQILDAALKLAEQGHYMTVYREAIAAEVGIAGPTIHYHFTTMAKLRRAMMRQAVTTECLPVIAQGITSKDSQALRAPMELRARALASL